MKIINMSKLIIGLSILSTSVFGTTVSDLKLECGGEYKILESNKYYVNNDGTRAASFYGDQEKVQILEVSGADCYKLIDGYGVTLSVGETIVLGQSRGHSKVNWLGINHEKIGKVVNFNVEQNFSYKMKNDELPWFPTLHKETISVLGKHGVANVDFLYGVQSIKKVSDHKKLEIVEELVKELKWGKVLSGSYIGHYDSTKLDLILELIPSSEDAQLTYLSKIFLIFRNSANNKVSLSKHLVPLAYSVNKLLNKFGKTKYGSSKLEVWKKNPIFFDHQSVSWVFDKVDKAPILTINEIEQYLSYALDMSKKLKEVQNLYEAIVLLKQYKNSAIIIKKFSSVEYELNEKSSEYLEQLLKL